MNVYGDLRTRSLSAAWKRASWGLLIVVLAFMLSACAQTPVAEAPGGTAGETSVAALAPQLDKELVILYTNDVHCAVDDAIGYAGLAALRAQLVAEDKHVVLVDAGDVVTGDFIGVASRGAYLVDIMNQMPYDIAIPGNHEFDYGTDRFFELVEMADYPYLAVNVIDLATGKTLLPPSAIMEFNGVKIGFVGVTTPKIISTSVPAYFQDEAGAFIYDFCQDQSGEALYTAVQEAVDQVREQGAHYVILLAHLGISYEVSPWTSSEVIENTTGIDAVLDGHSHSVLECERVKNKEGRWTLLSSTGTKLNAVGQLRLTPEGTMTTGLIVDYTEKDPEMERYIEEIQSEYEAELNTVVARSEVDLTIVEPGTNIRIVRNAETNLGDLCADAYRAIGQADIAIVNSGGIRESIPAGDITLGQIFAVDPFSNYLCVAEVTGQEILDALEMSCRATPEESSQFSQLSGMTYEFDVNIPSPVKLDENGMFIGIDGERRVQSVWVDGQPLDPEKTYTLAANDYLLKYAGNGYTMFQDSVLLRDSFLSTQQVLLNYITEQLKGVIGADYADPYGQERIVAVE